MSYADKYSEAMSKLKDAQIDNGAIAARKNAQETLERLEKDYKAGRVEEDEYVQKRMMLARKLAQPNP